MSLSGAQLINYSLELAQFAHRNQFDKNNIPYMYHIYGVWNRLSYYEYETQALGILHDIVEDTEFTLYVLEHLGYSIDFIIALESVSRKKDEKYTDFIQRAKHHPRGRIVKEADLQDNLYRGRLFIELNRTDIVKIKKIESLIKRYENALDILKE